MRGLASGLDARISSMVLFIAFIHIPLLQCREGVKIALENPVLNQGMQQHKRPGKSPAFCRIN